MAHATGGGAMSSRLLWVLFPELRVVHAGDIFEGKAVPILSMRCGTRRKPGDPPKIPRERGPSLHATLARSPCSRTWTPFSTRSS